ncbi:hypothetical protein D9758_014034 [Tetrapyrgos nigripes]|uniref:C2H2-type domain-containing protein n=1 Tax=Tetrapyrgos nigripes TaxID=182062 RepID=A0A8H5CZ86_9AGAR|nr:hypothetical protein D9758_014034 [Tetrapyrgos nigripes]
MAAMVASSHGPSLPSVPSSTASFTSSQLGKRCRPAPPKTFQCRGYGDCKMVFSRSEHLARHIRKHTGERPFACHCSKQFSRLDNLRQHAQTVHADKQDANERMMRELTSLHATMAAASKAGTGRGRRASSNSSSMMAIKREPSLYDDPAMSSSLWQMPDENDVDMETLSMSQRSSPAHSPSGNNQSFRSITDDLSQSFLDSKPPAPSQSFRDREPRISNINIGLGADQSFRSSSLPVSASNGRTPSPHHHSSPQTNSPTSASTSTSPTSYSHSRSPYDNQSFPTPSHHTQQQQSQSGYSPYSQLPVDSPNSHDELELFKYDPYDRPLSSSGAGWRELAEYAGTGTSAGPGADASGSGSSDSPFSFNVNASVGGGPSGTTSAGNVVGGSGSGASGYGGHGYVEYGYGKLTNTLEEDLTRTSPKASTTTVPNHDPNLDDLPFWNYVESKEQTMPLELQIDLRTKGKHDKPEDRAKAKQEKGQKGENREQVQAASYSAELVRQQKEQMLKMKESLQRQKPPSRPSQAPHPPSQSQALPHPPHPQQASLPTSTSLGPHTQHPHPHSRPRIVHTHIQTHTSPIQPQSQFPLGLVEGMDTVDMDTVDMELVDMDMDSGAMESSRDMDLEPQSLAMAEAQFSPAHTPIVPSQASFLTTESATPQQLQQQPQPLRFRSLSHHDAFEEAKGLGRLYANANPAHQSLLPPHSPLRAYSDFVNGSGDGFQAQPGAVPLVRDMQRQRRQMELAEAYQRHRQREPQQQQIQSHNLHSSSTLSHTHPYLHPHPQSHHIHPHTNPHHHPLEHRHQSPPQTQSRLRPRQTLSQTSNPNHNAILIQSQTRDQTGPHHQYHHRIRRSMSMPMEHGVGLGGVGAHLGIGIGGGGRSGHGGIVGTSSMNAMMGTSMHRRPSQPVQTRPDMDLGMLSAGVNGTLGDMFSNPSPNRVPDSFSGVGPGLGFDIDSVSGSGQYDIDAHALQGLRFEGFENGIGSGFSS